MSQSLTLGIAAKAALINEIPGETLDGEQRYKMGKMAEAVDKSMKNGGVADLSVEEVSLLKDRIGKSCPTWTVKQAWDLLENA